MAKPVRSAAVQNVGEPWLTVVMPVHNGATYLGATLESLVAHAGAGVEILLIDSTHDNSCREIVDRFMDRLPIGYARRPDLQPWQSKTNEAVAQARGRYIAMLHQDDLWLPARVYTIRQAIDRHPDAVVHLSSAVFVDHSGRKVGSWKCPLADREVWHGNDIFERLLVQNFIAIPAPVIRRDDWLAVGGLDERLWYTADWDLYLKLCERGDFTYIKSATVAFRVHSQSLTMTGSRSIDDFREQLEIVLERHLHQFPSKARDDREKLARVSVATNAILAATMNGKVRHLWLLLLEIARMRPSQFIRYLHYSRIVERILPRLRVL